MESEKRWQKLRGSYAHPNWDTHPNRAYTLFCGAYAFGDPIRTIGEQAPQLDYNELTGQPV